MKYNFNYCWHFKLADAFPLKDALKKHSDSAGRYFYEREYQETDWKEVSLPHTFNDEDLFVNRIKDAGSGQKRTCSFYRKWVDLSDKPKDSKILLAFEGVRQTCYLYVNGRMAGYCENGVAPFGFDITEFVDFERENLIAVASDNTCTRDIPFCIAETPNKPDVEPGSYLASQEEQVAPEREGVGYFWNCNDFNPSVGGITRPVELHVKPKVYLTLPLYSNLKTGGVYVYSADFDTENNTARVCVSAEVRNETAADVKARLKVTVETLDGNLAGTFYSEEMTVPAVGEVKSRLSITPEDAYTEEYLTDEAAAEKPYEGEAAAGILAEGGSAADGKECTSQEGENGKANTVKHYVPREEDEVVPTVSDSVKVTVLSAESETLQLRFWNIEDPYLYRVKVELECGGEVIDSETVETGFREVGYDKDRGVLINGHRVWLTGYAQRAANEWPAIGIAPQWLKDQDMMWVKESNSNHIRWMHVAASPADIRSCDRHGVVVTQPAGDKEAENFGRRWDQRVELMRDVIIAFRNHPSILFWEAGNNRINASHMREMTLLKRKLDPDGGRFMGCRTLNTEEDVAESEYVGTMLNRHAARAWAEHGPLTETEYSREEAARRIWDDFTPPDYDFRGRYLGKGGKKQPGRDFYDLTMEDLILAEAKGYAEFFHDRIGGASGKDMYSATAALCWTDSAQHGRQAYSENCRMSGRVDASRIPKQNFAVYQAMQSKTPMVKVIGHWNYPQESEDTYRYPLKQFNGEYWEETGEYAYRNPKHKTVYVAASYDILKVELFVNGKSVGVSEKPIDGFIFPIEGVDVTQSGEVTAVGYCRNGMAQDTIYTAGEPAALRLEIHTAPDGLLADGADIAYLDVEVVDRNGRRCPLCADR
ncbi:MAG: hypothetical protein LUC95_10875, partial [Lachnospiraceae bacterium]|nr:hypothetical protein [Lachnospiraceae bacterium]